MKKNQITIEKKFRLKVQTAIDVINSLYSYDHVKFFVELIPDLVLNNDWPNLNKQNAENLGLLIKIMTKLIDSREMTEMLKSFSQLDVIKQKPSVPLLEKIDIAYRSTVLSEQMLNWLNNLAPEKKRSMKPLQAMNEFFYSEIFFNEFLDWLNLINLSKKTTLVELLDAYYNWFPFTSKFRRTQTKRI